MTIFNYLWQNLGCQWPFSLFIEVLRNDFLPEPLKKFVNRFDPFGLHFWTTSFEPDVFFGFNL